MLASRRILSTWATSNDVVNPSCSADMTQIFKIWPIHFGTSEDDRGRYFSGVCACHHAFICAVLFILHCRFPPSRQVSTSPFIYTVTSIISLSLDFYAGRSEKTPEYVQINYYLLKIGSHYFGALSDCISILLGLKRLLQMKERHRGMY